MGPWKLQKLVGRRRSQNGDGASAAPENGGPAEGQKQETEAKPEVVQSEESEEDDDVPEFLSPPVAPPTESTSEARETKRRGSRAQKEDSEVQDRVRRSSDHRRKSKHDRGTSARGTRSPATSSYLPAPKVSPNTSQRQDEDTRKLEEGVRELLAAAAAKSKSDQNRSDRGAQRGSVLALKQKGLVTQLKSDFEGIQHEETVEIHGEPAKIRKHRKTSDTETDRKRTDRRKKNSGGSKVEADGGSSAVSPRLSGRRSGANGPQKTRKDASGRNKEERRRASTRVAAEGSERRGKEGTLESDEEKPAKGRGSATSTTLRSGPKKGAERKPSGDARRAPSREQSAVREGDSGGARSASDNPNFSRDSLLDKGEDGARRKYGEGRTVSLVGSQEEGTVKDTSAPVLLALSSRDDDEEFRTAMRSSTDPTDLIELALRQLGALDKFVRRPDGLAIATLEKTRSLQDRVNRDTQRLMSVLEEAKRAVPQKFEKRRQTVATAQSGQADQALLDTIAREREREKAGNLTGKLNKALGMKPTAAKRQLERLAELRRMTADPGLAPPAPVKVTRPPRVTLSTGSKLTANDSGSTVADA